MTKKEVPKVSSTIDEDVIARDKALHTAKGDVETDELSEMKFIEKLQSLVFWKRVASNPTSVWYGSWYVLVQFAVFMLKIARGVENEGFFGTHEYYMKLILTYGLNGESTKEPAIMSGFLAFLVLPFFVIILLGSLFFLIDSGYARNGLYPLDLLNLNTWAYFNQPAFGADVYMGDNAKWNMLYFPLLLLPIFLATIITLYHIKCTGKKSMLLDKVFIFFIMSWLVAWPMSSMTGTKLYLDWSELWQTLVISRRRNTFICYDGVYPVTALAIAAWLFTIVWVLLLNGLIPLMKTKPDWRSLARKPLNLIPSRRKESEMLPWDEPEANATAK